uniref:Beta-defensin n=1 Tax=Podarcis muralis TaxID=64176 RepID=A0A670HLU2_PODMU
MKTCAIYFFSLGVSAGQDLVRNEGQCRRKKVLCFKTRCNEHYRPTGKCAKNVECCRLM